MSSSYNHIDNRDNEHRDREKTKSEQHSANAFLVLAIFSDAISMIFDVAHIFGFFQNGFFFFKRIARIIPVARAAGPAGCGAVCTGGLAP